MSSYRDIKQECYEANLLLPQYNLVDLTFGNVSVADRSRGVFAIKPSGVEYLTMKPSEIVVVDFEGKIVEGSMRPSSDTPTHRRLLQAFADVHSIVHTHSRHAVAFAQAGRAIPCLGTTHADYFYGEIPITRHLTKKEINDAYEWETGNVIVERFAQLDPIKTPAVLVPCHGPFVWGVNGAKAVETALALEIIAQMAIQTLSINSANAPIQQPLMEKHFLRKHGNNSYYGQSQSMP